MILYLTYNDLPSGIYASQVIDVVKFIRDELKHDINLLAFISLRNFKVNKEKIKKEIPEAIVLPMFPGVHNWKKNKFLLNFICRTKKAELIIGRSILATHLALLSNTKKVVYDGRGAIEAEWKEYKVITKDTLINRVHELERIAVNNVSYRIAVSDQLVQHWRREFNYSSEHHVIIPCTLNKAFESIELSTANINAARNKIGLKESDIVFSYSGSLAGWQSFELLYNFLKEKVCDHENTKLLFLSEKDDHIQKLEIEFPGKIFCIQVSPYEVPKYLIAADYGLLIREETTTNRVASPVKYAEYLACGLKVIISDHLGDYSEFTRRNNLGSVYTDFELPEKISLAQKQTIRLMAMKYFTKKEYIKQYEKMISYTTK